MLPVCCRVSTQRYQPFSWYRLRLCFTRLLTPIILICSSPCFAAFALAFFLFKSSHLSSPTAIENRITFLEQMAFKFRNIFKTVAHGLALVTPLLVVPPTINLCRNEGGCHFNSSTCFSTSCVPMQKPNGDSKLYNAHRCSSRLL
jgi:hypothetical protein